MLHGTSGVPDEAVKECIKRGICKVNYATDLRIAFTNGVNRVFAEIQTPLTLRNIVRQVVKKLKNMLWTK